MRKSMRKLRWSHDPDTKQWAAKTNEWVVFQLIKQRHQYRLEHDGFVIGYFNYLVDAKHVAELIEKG